MPCKGKKASHLSDLLICQMTLLPPMSLASADSNGSFAQEQPLHQDHFWSSTHGERGSPGQLCQGRVAPGSAMEVFSWPCVLVREAAACWAALKQRCQQWKLSCVTLWGSEVKVKGLGFEVLACCVVPVR